MKSILLLIFLIVNIFCSAQNKTGYAAPSVKDGIYKIKIGVQEIETDPAIGGRITSLKLNGKNFLTGKDINETYWGSSFWPSPQNKFNSANLSELDAKPYSVSLEKNIIKMVSQKDPDFGFVFTKEISGNTSAQSFIIKYSITNQSDSTRKVAPWEVTRVHANGLAFFPRGEGERWGNIAKFAQDIDGITWYDHSQDKTPAQHNKFFSDGAEGWIAQVNDGNIFIKKFPAIRMEMAAPKESEIEVYTNPAKSYVEIEEQGAYEELKPGGTNSWTIEWYIRKLPAGIKSAAGNSALVEYVRKIVNTSKK